MRVKVSKLTCRRKVVRDRAYKELVSSIERHGQLEPLRVTKRGKRYRVRDGLARLEAMRELKIEFAEVTVLEEMCGSCGRPL